MRKSYLFIGGEADGLVIDVDEDVCEYMFPIRPQLFANNMEAFAHSDLKTAEYRRLRISATGFVYVLSHFSMDQAISKLVNSYRPVLL